MHYPNSEAKQARNRAEADPVTSRSPKPGSFQCLVVSEDALRCDMLDRSARQQSGWETIVCTEADSARRIALRTFLQLAIVDLESASGQRPEGFDALLEQLAETSEILLVACGNDGNIQEEIWSRQLGVWLYLPAVIDVEGMATMCGEARQIAERRVAVP
jgi:ActR/RegA family two-component response regulator